MTTKQPKLDPVDAAIGATDRTYGSIERLAGVVDRAAFWQGKTEDMGRTELKARIRERLKAKKKASS